MSNQTQPRIAIPTPTLTDHVYNQRSWPLYAEAIRQAGGIPIEIPLTEDPTALLKTCQATLLPGSGFDVDPTRYAQTPIPACNPADPAREAADLRLLEDAYHHRKPLFAICFGTQMLNVWRGGTLIQDLPPVPVNHPAGRSVLIAHTAAIAPASLLASIVDPAEAHVAIDAKDHHLRLPINSSHHQSVAYPGQNLRISARCPQDDVIEALEGDDPTHYVLAVQWHPERTTTQSPTSRALFHRFLAAI